MFDEMDTIIKQFDDSMSTYKIIGDTSLYNDCLIELYSGTLEGAAAELERLAANPGRYTNIRLEKSTGREWWHDSFLIS